MYCLNCDGSCGLSEVKDERCCHFCDHKEGCKGFCAELEELGDTEQVAINCYLFSKEGKHWL